MIGKLIDKYGVKYIEVNGTCYRYGTPERVITSLEGARKNNWRVKIDYGNVQTGKSWNETSGVSGYISRSTGCIKIPILVFNKRSYGGGGILTHDILSIKFSNKKEGGYLYKS